ncbi:hypothetical protein ACH61_03052 [Rathayibacter tanaceti]|uniref:Uncharacterized protein n=1 Tax=Rathayibacter tanaceti TaxID=1671680 RepID=A0A162GMC1_9MICO|nr:hypothetical protein ACH61_03052 [Rathayibacter tanaceti]
MGTVETTVMPCVVSHGPRSIPLRTSERGAGTRQAPCRQASHISSQEASNATERPASTRSPGPSGSCWRNSRASASTRAAAERWLTATPFGVPVDPDVKMIQASSSSEGGWASGIEAVLGCGAAPVDRREAGAGASLRSKRPEPVITPRTQASPNTSRARSSGSSASTGT